MATSTTPLPYCPPVEAPDPETRTVRLGTAETAEVCGLLAAETARAVLASLSEEPATVSDLAEGLDTSIQNAQYHVTRLRDGGLIRVVDTWYSSRGAEMKVYAPAYDRLVIDADPSDGAS